MFRCWLGDLYSINVMDGLTLKFPTAIYILMMDINIDKMKRWRML